MNRLLLLLIALFSFTYTNAQVTYQKSYGGPKWEYARHMSQTSDSGFIITGTKLRVNTSTGLDVYLLKLDANGEFLWNKTYGGSADDEGLYVQQTFDGGFIIAGITASFGAGLHDAYIIKTDSVGNLQWSKVMGTGQYDNVVSAKQTPDSGFIFTGMIYAYNGSGSNLYLIKTDVNGDTLWTRGLGTVGEDTGLTLRLTGDGGYIITGWSDSSAISRVYLLKTDSLGFPLWAKTYGGSAIDEGWDVQLTADGGFIIVGNSYFGAGNKDVYLIKTDSIGDMMWSKTYGGPGYEHGFSVLQTSDGGYIISGGTASIAGAYDIYLIKTNATGDTLWTKTIVGAQSSMGGVSVLNAPDGGYFIAADSYFVPGNTHDILLIKTDSLGNSGCNVGNTTTIVNSPPTQVTSQPVTVFPGGVISSSTEIIFGTAISVTTLCTSTSLSEIVDAGELFDIYPNPSNGNFSISSNSFDTYRIEIYNPLGELVYSKKIMNQSSNSTEQITIESKGGLFIVKFIADEKYVCKKIFIDHN